MPLLDPVTNTLAPLRDSVAKIKYTILMACHYTNTHGKGVSEAFNRNNADVFNDLETILAVNCHFINKI